MEGVSTRAERTDFSEHERLGQRPGGLKEAGKCSL